MPINPPSAPYDTADTVLNFARVSINDAIEGLSGELLSNSQPYTFTLLNSAWRRLQSDLRELGHDDMYSEAVLLDITACQTTDPGIFCYIDWGGYFDGATYQASPTLPGDLIVPVRLWERMNGSNDIFLDMAETADGLPGRSKGAWNMEWEWRGDALWFVGATQANDIRMRYEKFLPDIDAAGSALVPLMYCARTLALYVAAEFCASRGSGSAATFFQLGQEEARRMARRSVRRKQRGAHRRLPYGAGGFGRYRGNSFF